MSRELTPEEGIAGLTETYPNSDNPNATLEDQRDCVYKDQAIHLTSFSGGQRGRCIQVTIGDKYSQIDRDSVQELVNTLNEWLEETK